MGGFQIFSIKNNDIDTWKDAQITSSQSKKNLEIRKTNNKYWRGCGEPSYTAGGKVNWCSHYGEQYEGSSKN